ncbi:MAG: flagellar hook assembly protein FlgD [Bdellovibrionales bacterium]
MTGLSALSTQNIALTNDTSVETRSTAEIAAEDAEEQKADFLELLLTQLENQNPLDPLDTDQWTAQLTRYSILEQSIETNQKLEVANSLHETNANNTSLSYIGEEIEVSTNTAPVQDGVAQWSYSIDGLADDVSLVVLDESGNVVEEVDGSITAGVHDFTLDAASLGLSDGAALELVIAARDSDGEAMDSRVSAHAVVDGVWTDTQNTYLTAGGVSFRREDILKVAELNQNQSETQTP